MKNIYLTKQQLHDAYSSYLNGDNTQLALAAQSIGHGICGWLHDRKFEFSEDDIVSEAVLIVLSKAHLIDPGKNIFNYLTTLIINRCRYTARQTNSDRTGLAKYAADLYGAFGYAGQEDWE